MTANERAAFIAKVVAGAPALDPEQRARLAQILRPAHRTARRGA